ncbi:hypothetical protein LEP1GSC060_3407 [Leptospira weilii serovar Ranarum str. ICFT]|uniref:Uncharacterized protein n=1 Tax=Leptospira weilii serovar Ranarum str. ICFT TaxID=1218598 RepID=N1WD69_9LEPT|nr:hypothetical protein LEP1GSC060_3407 [Leptospira weilii serovar Ranarum str. ICFT]
MLLEILRIVCADSGWIASEKKIDKMSVTQPTKIFFFIKSSNCNCSKEKINLRRSQIGFGICFSLTIEFMNMVCCGEYF